MLTAGVRLGCVHRTRDRQLPEQVLDYFPGKLVSVCHQEMLNSSEKTRCCPLHSTTCRAESSKRTSWAMGWLCLDRTITLNAEVIHQLPSSSSSCSTSYPFDKSQETKTGRQWQTKRARARMKKKKKREKIFSRKFFFRTPLLGHPCLFGNACKCNSKKKEKEMPSSRSPPYWLP